MAESYGEGDARMYTGICGFDEYPIACGELNAESDFVITINYVLFKFFYAFIELLRVIDDHIYSCFTDLIGRCFDYGTILFSFGCA